MKKFTLKGILALLLVVVLSATKLSAQTATITPTLSAIAVGGSQNFTVTTTGFGNSGNDRTFAFTITGPGATIPASANINCTTGCTSQSQSFQFNTAGTYTVTCTVTRNSTVASTSTTIDVMAAPAAANLWATSSDGNQISSFTVSNGVYFSGPTNIFDPFPSTNETTAALGRNDKPSAALGYFYWLPNSGTNGVVNVYAASSTGASRTLIGTLDVNGASNNTLGFVRLGMGPDGTGWILAGDNSRLYLAKFMSNGVNPVTITIEDDNVQLSVGASASTFQNGDICVSGTGNLYALANDGGGVTQIFTGFPAGSSTTLTKKLDLEDNAGNAFTGRVNGVAFDLLGSLYISTDNGLYFINQFTVNGPAGTVSCNLVRSQTGLQDLASNVFPSQSTLPVQLLSFTGNYRNQNTTLSWEVENMQNFSHFEVERSSDGASYATIAAKQPVGDPAVRATYQHIDNLSAVAGNVFYYRLKMVDNDGKFKYSSIILVRKEGKTITGINISPNPMVSGDMITVRFEAASNATVDFKLVDMTGRVVITQQNKVSEGTNSVSISKLDRLQPGMYILQMNDGSAVQTTKLIISK